ncbi:hypothetical protein [Arthrobacter mobilis]|uniref:HNH endonuclease n=1 Tax=Arthrobacter mobilis TaxID=2724944 RepID=A0A7X6K5B4_9MICC|nr:hypothetical protein [Arthrobacter mobilis]NKX56272.1 hypothetical protein [Arthrobacter mobilis]
MDEEATVLRRKEQAYLRNYVLPGNAGICALCERIMPIEFLVAAHIKRRSACSDTEKQDFENIAMPNCKLGCDELFGRGFICLNAEGTVEVSSLAPDVGAVAVYINNHLRGRKPEFWKEHPASHRYFEHHRLKDFVN